MNGFESVRRCITDYTSAGQWSEVYNGPVEDCEEYRLREENDSMSREHSRTLLELGYARDRVDELWDENRKLRELVEDMWHVFGHSECNACERFDTCSGYPCAFHDRAIALGVEVH